MKRSSLLGAFAAAQALVVALTAPARAEMVTLRCGGHTLDLDLPARTATWISAGQSRTLTITAVTDRFVAFVNPAGQPMRLDRVTGEEGAFFDGNWHAVEPCQRAGKPVL